LIPGGLLVVCAKLKLPETRHLAAGAFASWPVFGLGTRKNKRTGEALRPAKADNPQFRDYPITEHAADMPKSTRMTQLRHCGARRKCTAKLSCPILIHIKIAVAGVWLSISVAERIESSQSRFEARD
jgi:hypothetical protein